MSHLTIHVQADNKIALAYLLKMGGTCNPQIFKISKSIRNYLLSHLITGTLPRRLNIRADWKSRYATHSSDWKLHQSFSENNQALRNPISRSACLQAVSPTSPIYCMKARSKQFCYRCNATGLEQNVFAFPHFCLIVRVLNEVLGENVEAMILVTPIWQT